jgi:hypothetical protein
LGILAGFDYGRVWIDDDPSVEGGTSDVWHNSFGGGIWISPMDIITMQFSIFKGDDDKGLFSFGGKFFF